MNPKILYGLIAVIVLISALNLVLLTGKTQEISANTIKAKEDARPADIQVIKLKDSACTDCFNIEKVLDDLKSKNVNVIKEESVDPYSDQGKELVSRLGITKLPTLIISGEIKKPSIENIWKSGWETKSASGKDSVVYTNILPPYVNPSTKEVLGRVSLWYIIDSSCKECQGLLSLVSGLKAQGVALAQEKTIEYKTSEAQDLIKKLGIQRIPAVVLSKNILEYPSVKEALETSDIQEKEGLLAIEVPSPPYKDVASGQIKGLVKAIYLNDSSCKSCYDVSSLRNIVSNVIGLTVAEEKNIDISSDEGKETLNKYKIEKAPTLLLSGESADYPGFSTAFAQVGSQENDGWFVIRNPQIFGGYKDLTTGQEVAVKAGQTKR